MRGSRLKHGNHSHRVAIIQRELPHYRTPFYECLRLELDARGVGIDVIESNADVSKRLPGDIGHVPWAHKASGIQIGIGDRRLLWQRVGPRLRAADLVIVEQASRLLLNYLLFARQSFLRRPMAFWGHGRSFHSEAVASSVGESIKRWLSQRVHWWFAYNDLSAQVINEFGFPVDRITVVQNSTDTRGFRELVDRASAENVEELRERYGLQSGQTAVFVGSFHPEKRLAFLFEAIQHLHQHDSGFSLLVVGSGIEQSLVETMSMSRSYVHYLGNLFDSDLAAALAAADVVLVPGWAGLVIVDAFAAGVPIVVSSSFPHPPEISYIESGVNGLLVDDDGCPKRYAERVRALLEDVDEYRRLVRGCADAAETYSVEAMAKRFADGIVEALSPRFA